MRIKHNPGPFTTVIEENSSFTTEVENDEELALFLSEMTTNED